MATKLQTQLLIIDGQEDFVDTPQALLPRIYVPNTATGKTEEVIFTPQLAVPGAYEDCLRLAELIRRGSRGLDDITLTFDSHHAVGIERPTYWRKGDGGEVSPFTEITAAQVRSGEYLPRNLQLLDRTLAYLDSLEKRGRYKLMVWTVHCVTGTWGHNLQRDLEAAVRSWEVANCATSNKLTKGSNPFTEHYGAFEAEVPDPADESTRVDMAKIKMFQDSRVLIAGQASSHCVRESIYQLTRYIGDSHLQNLILLEDAMSPVPGYEAQAIQFLNDMRSKGVQIVKCDDILPELM
jgi:nicotinamidase-related amidase